MMANSSCSATATKKVQPKERILNDDVAGVDYLGHTVYAQALAQTIKSVNPPVTVGVYGRWGSGKTFLIKEVCNILKREQKQRLAAKELYPMSGGRFFSPVIVLALLGLSLLAAGVILVIPGAFNPHTLPPTVQTVKAAAVMAHPKTLTVRQGVGIAALVLACVVALSSFFLFFMHDAYPPDQGVLSNMKLLLVALLARLPIASEQRGFVRGDQESYRLEFQESTETISSLPGQKKVKYLFVDFNAWACTGTDNLWAGVAIALANAVELEFGKVTTRLSRMFQIDKIPVEDSTVDASKCLFVNLGCNQDYALNVLQVYGPTDIFQTYSDWKEQTSGEKQQSSNSSSFSGWWYVSFRSSLDALNALECLSKKGVEITKQDPFVRKINESTITGETHPLLKASKDDSESSKTPSKGKGFCYLLRNYPKTACGVPVLFWLVMTAFVVLIPVPLIVCANVTSSSVPTFVQVFAWVPATAAGIYAGVKFLYAMCNSQISRIYSMLGGTKGKLSAQLGVMNNIKLEIQHITNLIQCAETTHNLVYKFLIVIDDLDKIQLSTVKSVLDAVSILLSDRLSPFICLMSINSRVAVESVEQAFNITKTEANVNARLYLRKIINLPFCVPRAHKKKQYIGGLIDQTDVVVNKPIVSRSKPSEKAQKLEILNLGPPDTEELDSKRFLFECRQYFHSETVVQRHLEENPRLIKRIFNIITLTAIVINRFEDEEQRRAYIESVTGGFLFLHVKSIRTKAFARDLVRWIILTEQWPFRTSYILQIIKDADRREEADKNDPYVIANDESLIKIYETRVQPELAAVTSSSMTRIDGNAELFHSFLHELKGHGMTKSKALLLQNYMINLDHGVGRYIEEVSPMKALEATDLLNKATTPSSAAASSGSKTSDTTSTGSGK